MTTHEHQDGWRKSSFSNTGNGCFVRDRSRCVGAGRTRYRRPGGSGLPRSDKQFSGQMNEPRSCFSSTTSCYQHVENN
jgi:hypothetical protein